MKKEKKMLLFGSFIILLLLSLSSVTLPIFVSQTIQNQNIIFIDPGHGGTQLRK